jgi:transcriptional regulator with XRE-family HTH domain
LTKLDVAITFNIDKGEGMSPQINKSDIMPLISELIENSNLNDTEIAERAGVSRQMIFKWRKGNVGSIRKANLVSLADALNYKIEFDNDLIFLDKLIIELDEGGEDMSILAQDLIKQKDKHILLLEKTLERAELTIDEQSAAIVKLDETVKQLIDKPDINLDNTRMQCVVDMQTQTFVNCTQLYSDLYNADAFDVIKNYSWSDVVHEDDYWRFAHFPYEDQSKKERPTTWKLKGSNGKVIYIETVSIILDDEKRYRKVDAKVSTKEKHESCDDYYKAIVIPLKN